MDFLLVYLNPVRNFIAEDNQELQIMVLYILYTYLV